jgi:hypothetical protein
MLRYAKTPVHSGHPGCPQCGELIVESYGGRANIEFSYSWELVAGGAMSYAMRCILTGWCALVNPPVFIDRVLVVLLRAFAYLPCIFI